MERLLFRAGVTVTHDPFVISCRCARSRIGFDRETAPTMHRNRLHRSRVVNSLCYFYRGRVESQYMSIKCDYRMKQKSIYYNSDKPATFSADSERRRERFLLKRFRVRIIVISLTRDSLAIGSRRRREQFLLKRDSIGRAILLFAFRFQIRDHPRFGVLDERH